MYDGTTDQSNEIEKLSGNLGSFDMPSIGNTLFVKFESDSSNVKDGFFATIHYSNIFSLFVTVVAWGMDGVIELGFPTLEA